jgi:hypothetical protein
MKIIFSYTTQTEGAPSPNWPQLAALSNYYFKHQGFETIFFGDDIALNLFKNIKYDHFELIKNNELDQFPKCLWSMIKLIAISKINEPFIHVDMDLLYMKIDKDKINKDVVCLHDEFFLNTSMKRLQNFFNIQPIENEEIYSYNCGILGGNDYITFHKAINILFQFINNNYDHISNVYNAQHKNLENKYFFYPAVLVEQIWFFQILKSLDAKINTICGNSKNWDLLRILLSRNNIIHLMQSKKLDMSIRWVNANTQLLNLEY